LTTVRVGVAGWLYPDWEHIVYPPSKPARFDPLAFIVRFFDAIEINSTFYRPPTPKTAVSWARRAEANPRFRFTVKLYKGFTHERSASHRDERVVKEGLEPLIDRDRLGALLIQFPWSFKNESGSRRYLEDLLNRFQELPRAVELRHSSWDQPEFYAYLSSRRVGFCNIDQPRIGRSLGPSSKSTGPVGYVRLHGRNYKEWFSEDTGRDARYDYLYSEDELEPWLERIGQVTESAAETYVITNNHFRGKAAVNALQIRSKIEGKKVEAPASLVSAYPVLEPITEKVGEPIQERLFD
jgi:uncharacterized protein YecE (DUF72 family)